MMLQTTLSVVALMVATAAAFKLPYLSAVTEGKVYHIEEDLGEPGLLFADEHAIKNWNGRTTGTIAGNAYLGAYLEGDGSRARFYHITGFVQLSRDMLVVVDSGNHCLRKIDRSTGETTPYAGNCTISGYRHSPNPLFNRPYGIVRDVKRSGRLIVTEQINKALRAIEPGFEDNSVNVETLIESDILNAAYGITADRTTGNLYIAVLHAVIMYDYDEHSLTILCGSYEPGFEDGPFENSQFNRPSEVLLIETGLFLLVADTSNNAVRHLDIRTRITLTITITDFSPFSLLLHNNTLYIGTDGRFNIIQEWAKVMESTITHATTTQRTTTTPPTTTTSPTTTTTTTPTTTTTTTTTIETNSTTDTSRNSQPMGEITGAPIDAAVDLTAVAIISGSVVLSLLIVVSAAVCFYRIRKSRSDTSINTVREDVMNDPTHYDYEEITNVVRLSKLYNQEKTTTNNTGVVLQRAENEYEDASDGSAFDHPVLRENQYDDITAVSSPAVDGEMEYETPVITQHVYAQPVVPDNEEHVYNRMQFNTQSQITRHEEGS